MALSRNNVTNPVSEEDESHRQTSESDRKTPEDLLIVGTLGGGGVHHYIDEQADRLPTGLSVRVYDMVTPSTGSGIVWFLTSLLRSLWAALKFPLRKPADIVHVHCSHEFSFYRASFYVLFSSYVWRRPVILHIHGSSFDDFMETDDIAVRWLQSLVFAATDRVIVLSEYWRDVLSAHVPANKIQVLPNAVDPDEYNPTFGGDPPHIVFVSNLIERKGVQELVEAFEMLSERGVDFRATVAGSGSLSAEVEELTARTEHIDYAGYVSEQRKRELLDSGAIFVLPTYAEGLPIAMLEGMAGGNAIVSTTVGSIPEVIGKENGILIEPGDSEALANALEVLVEKPEMIERMARQNRALIQEKYSWERISDQLEVMYANEYRTAPGSPGVVGA